MVTNWYLVTILAAAIGCTPCSEAQSVRESESLYQRMSRASQIEQLEYLDIRLNQGFRPVNDDALDAVLEHPAVALPLVEKKIEEVLRSPDPKECFTDPQADPKYFVDMGAAWIASAGDEYAMKEIAKLVAFDERRFGRLVVTLLHSVRDGANPFGIAYKGLDIGSQKVDKWILAWADEEFENKTDFWQGRLKQLWAEAVAERYDNIMLPATWDNDPIASRIRRETADAVHDDVLRLAVEAREKLTKKQRPL